MAPSSSSLAGRNSRFTDRLTLRVQPALPRAIDAAAAKMLTTPSEYVRRSVIDRLKADGIDPAHLGALR